MLKLKKLVTDDNVSVGEYIRDRINTILINEVGCDNHLWEEVYIDKLMQLFREYVSDDCELSFNLIVSNAQLQLIPSNKDTVEFFKFLELND